MVIFFDNFLMSYKQQAYVVFVLLRAVQTNLENIILFRAPCVLYSMSMYVCVQKMYVCLYNACMYVYRLEMYVCLYNVCKYVSVQKLCVCLYNVCMYVYRLYMHVFITYVCILEMYV